MGHSGTREVSHWLKITQLVSGRVGSLPHTLCLPVFNHAVSDHSFSRGSPCASSSDSPLHVGFQPSLSHPILSLVNLKYSRFPLLPISLVTPRFIPLGQTSLLIVQQPNCHAHLVFGGRFLLLIQQESAWLPWKVWCEAAGPQSLVYSREDRPTANTHVHVSSHPISSLQTCSASSFLHFSC